VFEETLEWKVNQVAVNHDSFMLTINYPNQTMYYLLANCFAICSLCLCNYLFIKVSGY